MSDVSFKRTVFEIDLYGETVKLRKPTGMEKEKYLGELEELQKKIEMKQKVDEHADYNITKALMEELGLNAELWDSMQEDHQVELINVVFNRKKN
jgi:hypothetical protein